MTTEQKNMHRAARTTRCVRRITSIEDVLALEALPYDELVPARSVYELFANTAALHGERPALSVLASPDPTDVALALTHCELLWEITRAANLFRALGIGGNDVVSIVAKTHARVPVLIWGAEVAGVASCLNYLLNAQVLVELLRAEQARVLVCPGPQADAELWERMQAVIPQLPLLKAVLVIGGGAPAHPLYLDLDQALAGHQGDVLEVERPLGRDTPAALFHTGGTTGVPKLVPHTHGQQVHAAWCFAQTFGITEQDVGLNGLPMFHVGGTSTWGLSILGAGGHVVVMTPVGYRNPAVVQNVWRIAAYFKATMVGSVPTTIGTMSEVDTEGMDLSSLRLAHTGGAILPGPVAQRFEHRVGIPLLEQYGMTESVATITGTPFFGEHRRGSVGLRCPFSQLRVVQDPASVPMVDCLPGVAGTVVCRGRQIVRGYLDSRHDEGAFTADGWLITGDLGYLDANQWLVLTGREKDLIIRGGHNIDPASIEEIANAHPDVAVSAAVGMLDAYAGEVPVLFAVPMQGHTLSAAELATYILERIGEPPARPRHVFVIDALPTTTVGKIFKPMLRDQAIVEKLRLEVAALGTAGLVVQDVVLSSDLQGRKVATVLLGHTQVVDQIAVERRLYAAVGDLALQVRLCWA